jgi:hypothetical protein
MVISTSLLTTTPPLSSVLFQLTPKSWRLITVWARNPARVLGPFVHATFPPGRRPLPQIANLQTDVARDPSNGQLSRQDVIVVTNHFNLVPSEGNFGMMFHIEEVRTAKVRVSLRLSRPEGFGIDANFNPGFTRVLWIKYQLSLDVFEVATDTSHHHVPGAELSSRVSGLEKPLRHL